MKVDYWKIIDRYVTNDWTRKIYITHVGLVAAKAIKIAIGLELESSQVSFIEEAAMLHDIGIVKVNAPEIGCTGNLDYICHGVEGRKILENEGLLQHSLVAERHTGVGIPVTQIINENLPLPARDLLAITVEEKIISWADLFYSKTPARLLYEKTVNEAYTSIKDYGPEYIERFKEWERSFYIHS